MKIRIAAATLMTCAVGAPMALGQEREFFKRDRTVGVMQRPHPEYEAQGRRFGAFIVYPQVEVAAATTNNVYLSETDTRSDVALRINPRFEVTSDWVRHAVSAFARGSVSRSEDFDTENTDTWAVGANGRLDARRGTTLSAGAEHGRQTESRSSSGSPESLAEPVQYDRTSAYIAVSQELNRVRLSGRADVRTLDFENGRSLSGSVVDQQGRDQTTYTVMGQADYAISPATAVFARITVDERAFESSGPDGTPSRDSSGLALLAGLDFELTNLVRGSIAAGYIEQTFDEDAYGSFDGANGEIRLEYFPTELLTMGFSASRSVGDSGIPGTAGYLSTDYALTADYELRRNIVIEARTAYSIDEFSSIDRENRRWSGGVRGTYLVNRRIGVSLSYDHETRDSRGLQATSDFDVDRFLISLVAQY